MKLDAVEKCSTEKARDTVNAMLTLPENVPIIMAALEGRFGRADLIIGSMIMKISQMSAVSDDKPDTIIDLSNAVIGLVASMRSLGHCEHMQSLQLLQELVAKLTPSLLLQWGGVATNGFVDVSSFSDWLLTITDAASFITIPYTAKKDVREQNERKQHARKEAVFATVNSGEANRSSECAICGRQAPGPTECRELQSSAVSKRWKLVKQKRLCFRCLEKKHRAMECQSKIKCDVENCDRNHHPMLHDERELFQSRNEFAGAVYFHSNCLPTQELLRILPVTLHRLLGDYHNYALLDEGSTVTLLTQSVANAVGAKGIRDTLRLQLTRNMSQSNENSQRVDLAFQNWML